MSDLEKYARKFQIREVMSFCYRDYLVEFFLNEEDIEVYLSCTGYGIKYLLFGIKIFELELNESYKHQLTELVLANIEDYIKIYKEKFED